MADIQTYLYGKKFPNRIFVGGLPLNTNAYELADFFNVFGHVTESKIILDDSGLSKGYGFVTFEQKSSVRKVESMGIIYFKNKKINIGPAVKKEASIVQPEMVMWPQSCPVISAAATNVMSQPNFPYQSPYSMEYVPQPMEPFVGNDGIYYWMTYPMANMYNSIAMNQNIQPQIPYSPRDDRSNSTSSSSDEETKLRKSVYSAKRKDIPPRFQKK